MLVSGMVSSAEAALIRASFAAKGFVAGSLGRAWSSWSRAQRTLWEITWESVTSSVVRKRVARSRAMSLLDA